MRNVLSACFALAFTLFSLSIHAQIYGLRAGITYATEVLEVPFAENTTIEADYRMGFQAGVSGEYKLSDDFYINPGLLFLQAGYRVEDDGSYGGDDELVLNQVTIPVTGRYKHQLSDNATLFGEVGPYASYAFSGRDEVYNDFDFEENLYKQFDYGAQAGIGVEFSNTRIGFQYMFGIANLLDVNGSSDLKIRNRIFGLYIAALLGGHATE